MYNIKYMIIMTLSRDGETFRLPSDILYGDNGTGH
jgi:hypothetical protein